ncbi:MAG: hypothetical protein JXA08_05095 [Methanomicrobiaceae archaeon]|nr:hypothetical protein [Methanomicrobiaceae archaeon]
MVKRPVQLTLDDELVAETDRRRGLIPRSTYINEILSNSLASDDRAGRRPR